MKPLISVIVPVYKVEKYIQKCVKSIINQDYKNLEIILVNDGSPDNCAQICDDLSKCDDRIIVVQKTNGGLSDARNAGLQIMNGEYVTFVDSDDFVDCDYVSNLYELIIKYQCSISVTSFKMFKEGNEEKPMQKNIVSDKKLTADEALMSMFYQNLLENNSCSKLYETSLFRDIRFPVGFIYEDLMTTYKLILLSPNGVAVSNLKNYHYLLRDESIEGSPFNEKKNISYQFALRELVKLKKDYPNLNKPINCRILSFSFHLFFETLKGSKYENEIYKNIQQYRIGVIFDQQARAKARIAACISFLGKNALRYFYRFGNSRN